MSYLTLIITLPLTVFAILFAVSNSGDVTVGLWPLDQTHTVSIWVFGLAMLGVGFFTGALFVWILGQKTRFLYWKESRRAARLEKELDALNKKQTTSAPAPLNTEEPAALPAK